MMGMKQLNVNDGFDVNDEIGWLPAMDLPDNGFGTERCKLIEDLDDDWRLGLITARLKMRLPMGPNGMTITD